MYVFAATGFTSSSISSSSKLAASPASSTSDQPLRPGVAGTQWSGPFPSPSLQTREQPEDRFLVQPGGPAASSSSSAGAGVSVNRFDWAIVAETGESPGPCSPSSPFSFLPAAACSAVSLAPGPRSDDPRDLPQRLASNVQPPDGSLGHQEGRDAGDDPVPDVRVTEHAVGRGDPPVRVLCPDAGRATRDRDGGTQWYCSSSCSTPGPESGRQQQCGRGDDGQLTGRQH